MKYLHFFLIFGSSHLALAQGEMMIVTGTVLDGNHNPIPYASVGLLHHHLGTSTNQVGGFLMKIENDSLIKADTLVVSVLGYKSFRRAMSQINGALIIELEVHSYELKEVYVTDLSARAIVEKAFKLRKKNYPTKKFKTQAFYRGLIRNDSTYVMMTEGLVTTIDKGYHKMNDTKIYLNQLKYIDERKFDSLDIYYDTLAEVNEIYRLWRLDYMNWSFNKIDWFYNIDQVKYELDSISYFDNDPIFCISVKSRKQFFNQLFIKMDNFALIEAHRGWRFADAGRKSTNEKIGGIGSTIDGKNYRIEVIQYKEHNGKYFLSYASLATPVIGGDKQKVSRIAYENARSTGSNELNYGEIEYKGKVLDPDKNNYFRYDEIFITHIYTKKEDFLKNELMDKQKYVHRYAIPYNSKFWSMYKALQLNPNLKRAESHLKEAEILNTTKNREGL